MKRLKDRELVIRDSGIWGNYRGNKAEQEKYEEGKKFNSSKHMRWMYGCEGLIGNKGKVPMSVPTQVEFSLPSGW